MPSGSRVGMTRVFVKAVCQLTVGGSEFLLGAYLNER
jgi:hypothetical protein